MPQLTVSIPVIMGFVLVMARITGAFIFVPMPGIAASPSMARVLMALSITLALFPKWPHVDLGGAPVGGMAVALFAEMLLGLTIGIAVSVVSEAFLLAGQIIGLQAGYAYASTIDPTTQADSGILVVFAQLTAGLLFFTVGLDREVIRIFARSLDVLPAGTFVLTAKGAGQILHMASGMFSVGFRLALPAIALLMLVDLALALLGRLNQQLQLVMLAFPVKMMLAIGVLAAMAVLFPHVYLAYAEQALARAAVVAGF